MNKHNANSAGTYTKIELFTNFAETPDIFLPSPLEFIHYSSTFSSMPFNLSFKRSPWESKSEVIKTNLL